MNFYTECICVYASIISQMQPSVEWVILLIVKMKLHIRRERCHRSMTKAFLLWRANIKLDQNCAFLFSVDVFCRFQRNIPLDWLKSGEIFRQWIRPYRYEICIFKNVSLFQNANKYLVGCWTTVIRYEDFIGRRRKLVVRQNAYSYNLLERVAEFISVWCSVTYI